MGITILNCPWGNKFSIANALKLVDADFSIETASDALSKSDCLIIPGVGKFLNAYNYLLESEEILAIERFIEDGRKIIGICLGMQLLFSFSEEGNSPGLNIFDGNVLSFSLNNHPKTNTGWSKTFKLNDQSFDFYYFTHSYYCAPKDNSIVTSKSIFNKIEFVASIKKDNIYGFQFHPEKSGIHGLHLLKKTLEL